MFKAQNSKTGENSKPNRRKKSRPVSPASVLRRANRTPDLVLDVGVRRGTPFLYETFPDVEFVLIDPQKDGETLLTDRPKKFTFLNKAVGSAPGKMTLTEQDGLSSFLARKQSREVEVQYEIEVDVTTLDVILDNYPDKSKVGLKLDVEGYELEALKGLVRNIGKIDFIVAEVSVLNRFENGYDFSQMVAFLSDLDFRFYNLLGNTLVRPRNFLDCLFLRRNDPNFN